MLRATRFFAALVALAILVWPASAMAGAGLKPSQAPLVSVGKHYFGNTYHAANVGCCATADLWRLPVLLTADVVTVAWNGTTGGSEPNLCLGQDVDDYSWAQADNQCNGSDSYEVSGSGSARTLIEVKRSTSAPYLEFWGESCCNSQPYDFVVESIQHAIGVDLTAVLHIRSSAVLTAHAGLSDGSPVPDGLSFTLTASWSGHGSAQYSATSSAGTLRFPVTLPSSALGQTATFTVSRPADAQYLTAKSAALQVKVARYPVPPIHHHHRRHRHRHHHHHRRGH